MYNGLSEIKDTNKSVCILDMSAIQQDTLQWKQISDKILETKILIGNSSLKQNYNKPFLLIIKVDTINIDVN